MTAKMQSCVDHIKTSVDVDPWAAEMVEKIFAEYDRRFDKVLEIIDKESRYISSKEAYRNAACQDYWRSITSICRAIEELRGNNKQ